MEHENTCSAIINHPQTYTNRNWQQFDNINRIIAVYKLNKLFLYIRKVILLLLTASFFLCMKNISSFLVFPYVESCTMFVQLQTQTRIIPYLLHLMLSNTNTPNDSETTKSLCGQSQHVVPST